MGTDPILRSVALVLALGLGACAVPDDRAGRLILDPDAASQAAEARQIAALTQAFMALGPQVDPAEAARAARVSYEEVARLRGVYQITDGPLVHNAKVNMGLRPRGLCWHWAVDLGARLEREAFATLTVHQAIANYDNLRLEHSTVILGARGAPMQAGIVLDPWRAGGDLTWMPVREDTRYDWTARDEVFAWRRARGLAAPSYPKPLGG